MMHCPLNVKLKIIILENATCPVRFMVIIVMLLRFKYSRMSDIALVLPNISKDHSAFNFGVKWSKNIHTRKLRAS